MKSFNGAVASQPRKVVATAAETAADSLLQWGRGFAATEGPGWTAGRWPDVSLQWGRGFAATEGEARRAAGRKKKRSFNGAVASQPRKELSG